MECKEGLKDPRAQEYLQKRGISSFTANKYNLGFCSSWQSPAKIRAGEKAPTSARLILPITTNHYVARSIDPDNKLRYLDETGNGSKGLFNTDAIKKNDFCFVCEGVFDALSVAEAGQENFIALNSTAEAKLFVEYAPKHPDTLFLLVLDNDEPGKKAENFILDGLKNQNIIKINICAEYKDLNEAYTKEPKRFCNEVLKAAIDARNELAKQNRRKMRPDGVANYLLDAFKSELSDFQNNAHIKTGFADFDAKSGGLFPGLYVLAAASGLGKTTFAGQLCDNLAAAGHEVVYFSLEQSKLELVSKSLARLRAKGNGEKITSMQIRNGAEVGAEIEKYKEIGEHLSIYEANMQCNASFIGDYLKAHQERTGKKIIAVVDYLQILSAPTDAKTTGDTKQIVDLNVTNLKRISRELGATIICLCSINRNNYLLPVNFEAIKETGNIEFSADVVCGLQLRCLSDQAFIEEKSKARQWDKIKEEMKQPTRQIDLVCLKNRYGVTGWVCEFDYTPAQDLFEESFIDAKEIKTNYPF